MNKILSILIVIYSLSASAGEFSPPTGYRFDADLYLLNRDASFRKLNPNGVYSAIRFGLIENNAPYEIGSIGFNVYEVCGMQAAKKKLKNSSFEYSVLLTRNLYLHAVYVTEADIEYLESYACKNYGA